MKKKALEIIVRSNNITTLTIIWLFMMVMAFMAIVFSISLASTMSILFLLPFIVLGVMTWFVWEYKVRLHEVIEKNHKELKKYK